MPTELEPGVTACAAERANPWLAQLAVLLGQVDAAVGGPGQIVPDVNAGKAVALRVCEERRLPLARDVPTFKEWGFDVTLGTLEAIIAPRGTPASVHEAVRKNVIEPSVVSIAERRKTRSR